MATKRSKRYRKSAELVDPRKEYKLVEAVKLLKSMTPAKCDQTVDLAFRLGVDPKQSDQMVRGTVALPNGSGKKVRILVFAKGQAAEAAKAAGADMVGFEELVKKVTEGFQDFDVAIATPEAMSEVRKLGKILGPRGLMPNPKTGTVTDDTASAVNACKAGRVEFKVDKAANLHIVCGKFSFAEEKIQQNVAAVIDTVVKARPSSAKGAFIESCVLSATFTPGINIDTTDFSKN